METKYNLSHAREILEPCGVLGNYLNLDESGESGVWPAVERDLLLLPETEGLRWRPSRELQHLPNAPEVNDTPTLPNPFSARELAAFMLAGAGSLVADFYGNWNDGPDPDTLSVIDPDSRARRAVAEAFAAHRWARAQVGELDGGIEARRAAARKAYQNSPRDRELLQAFRDADAAWDAAYQTWLTAMVVCLLEPRPQAATEAPAPAQTPATPAPVVAVGEVLDTEPASEPPEWKARAAKRAAEIIASDRKKDLYPSQADIADAIAKEFRAAGVVGAGGKPMTGAYIKRHALKGISSEQGRQLSTATNRGK
jgi:hypothetical protein